MRLIMLRFFSLLHQFRNACLSLLFLAPFLIMGGANSGVGPGIVEAASKLPRPSQSSPIALGKGDKYVVNVNPEADTITVFQQVGHGLKKHGEVAVGGDPESVAISGQTAYVANARDGTVSVVQLPPRKVRNTLTVGAGPMAVALSPNET